MATTNKNHLMTGLPTMGQLADNVEKKFKQQISEDIKKRLDSFTLEENMKIAFAPIVISELAWQYAELVTDEAAQRRISETKGLSRQVKELRSYYVKSLYLDLTSDEVKRIELITDNFFIEHSGDFILLWNTLNNELKQRYDGIEHLNMRTNACMVVVLCDLLQEHTDAMDELIKAKMGGVKKVKNKVMEALKTGMLAYVSPAEFVKSKIVEMHIKVLRNRIDGIDYNL